MSGHSKWSTIKHKKGAADAKRGKIFTKIIREITIAARIGGGDINANPRLRMAVDNAKSNSMPKDNIERAIKKGSGALEGESYEEVTYEGYGPGGVAILVDVLTDNKNRTLPEIRHAFSRHNGNLGANGCVAWMFEKKGIIEINKTLVSEDKLMELAIDAGADDIETNDDIFEVIMAPQSMDVVGKAIKDAKIEVISSKLAMVPKSTVSVGEKDAGTLLKLIETLEDHDDVQNVYANFDISDDILSRIGE